MPIVLKNAALVAFFIGLFLTAVSILLHIFMPDKLAEGISHINAKFMLFVFTQIIILFGSSLIYLCLRAPNPAVGIWTIIIWLGSFGVLFYWLPDVMDLIALIPQIEINHPVLAIVRSYCALAGKQIVEFWQIILPMFLLIVTYIFVYPKYKDEIQ